MPESKPPHRIDRIVNLLVPDRRKRVGGTPVLHPWATPENYPLLVVLVGDGFMTGTVEDGIPQVKGLTWMGMDFFNACRNDNVRIRVRFCCHQDATLAQVYAAAVEINATYGQERNRRGRHYR